MLTDLHPYPAYKPSGEPWLGDMPKHWDVRRLKHWVGIDDSVLPETTDPDFAFRYLEIGAVEAGRLVEEPRPIRFADAPSRARRIVKSGDTIISTVRTYLKAVWFAGETGGDLICSTGFAVLTPHQETIPKFVSYVVQSDIFTDRVTAESVGIAYPAIGEGRFGSFEMCIPPLPEQRSIVRFLDHADEQIQRYIAAKERLIALLEEERQALVHEAVTRGLDPNVRLKVSGVEWLGDIPEHWEVRRIRSITEMRVSNVDKHTKEEEIPVRLCNYTDVYKNEVIDQALEFMPATASPEEVEKFRLEEQDVLISKDSETWDDIGIPALVVEPSEDLICGYHLAILRPREEITGSFLNLALRTQGAKVQFNIQARGVTRYGLTHNSILSVQLPLPPHQEQQAIVDYLTEANEGINETVARSQHQIDLMSEYRTRLIADVVTGQLDVRGAAEELPEHIGKIGAAR